MQLSLQLVSFNRTQVAHKRSNKTLRDDVLNL